METGECLQTFVGHQGPILSAKFSDDNRFIVSGGVDRSLKVWDIQTGKCLHSMSSHDGLIYTLDIGVVKLPTVEITPQLEYLCKTIESSKLVAFSGSLDETIKVWDLEAAKCLATWKPRRPYEGMQIDRIQGLTNAQRSTLLALGSDV